jgi:hypothetical protein
MKRFTMAIKITTTLTRTFLAETEAEARGEARRTGLFNSRASDKISVALLSVEDDPSP